MKSSTRRLVSFAAAILMAIAALMVFFDLLQPAYQDSQRLKGELISQQIALANEQKAVNQVKDLVAKYQGNTDPQKQVSLALPVSNDQAEVVHGIQSLAAMHNMAVQSLTVSQPGVRPTGQPARSGSASSTAIVVKPIGVVTAQVRVAGNYNDFHAFLNAVETNIRLTDIQSIVVSPVGKANQDFYTFDLTLLTYYQTP